MMESGKLSVSWGSDMRQFIAAIMNLKSPR
jgi:hypothetical protein